MNDNNPLLIPKFQRACHFIIRTPVFGPSWLILGIMAISGDANFAVRFILALTILIATVVTAWPTIILTPFVMLSSLFFLSKLNDAFLTFYIIYMVIGALVYGTYLLVTIRLISEKYVLDPVTREILYNPVKYIRGEIGSKNKKPREDTRNLKICLIAFLVVAFLVWFFVRINGSPYHVDPSDNSKQSTSSYSTSNDDAQEDYYVNLYRTKYPQTWNYIKKHADDPEEYVQIYHSIWGRLQEYYGINMAFGTLTAYEQSLINYPPIGAVVYYVKGSATYHATRYCYTLLRSDINTTSVKNVYKYFPCSKCVGE